VVEAPHKYTLPRLADTAMAICMPVVVVNSYLYVKHNRGPGRQQMDGEASQGPQHVINMLSREDR
jgi:hypothetical protein